MNRYAESTARMVENPVIRADSRPPSTRRTASVRMVRTHLTAAWDLLRSGFMHHPVQYRAPGRHRSRQW
jgi:hypothetical protein